ncbi:hypothetical protein BJ875DRAFT_422137 [Amylocarpus encephaloides]|uniref:RBR-type E3 ubiquitin transferase n=1 Tax=Amylocarpus encephaloides TaxID=45428 RepID=A0A9P7YKU5_9HELO|nr:hypothetical protein BJ875DRAFT_422137 [Amylocarpus encephaloides]
MLFLLLLTLKSYQPFLPYLIDTVSTHLYSKSRTSLEPHSLVVEMNIDEEQVAVALSEALTCYLGVLTRLDALRQARIPSKGKSAETTADISVEQDYRSRIAITELCLRFTMDIATDVFHWASEPLEDSDDSREIDITRANLFSKLESVTPDQPDELLIDIFSGKPIEILTPYSAGPSGTGIGQGEGESQEERLPDGATQVQPPSERCEKEDQRQSRHPEASRIARVATLNAKEKEKEELFQRLSQPKSPRTKHPIERKAESPPVRQGVLFRRLSQSNSLPKPETPIRRKAEITTVSQGVLFRRLSQPKSPRADLPVWKKNETIPVKQKIERVRIECTSCMELVTKRRAITLACKHTYCGSCLITAFQTALSSRTLFECCTTRVRPTVATSFLPPSFLQSYTSLTLELGTVNPLFCASVTCSKFIPPFSIHGPFAVCRQANCKTKTCVLCKRKVHKGVCKEDQEGRKVKEMAEMKGWKTCPFCGHMVERTEGCLHMTCRCKGEWCWSCRERWVRCKSTCDREGEA